MIRARWCPYRLDFLFEARTSRSSMRVKDTYFVDIYDDEDTSVPHRYGECALFKGLSADDRDDYEERLAEACSAPEEALNSPYSSIRFGFESALRPPVSNAWTEGEEGITINGLIWMGDKATMTRRIAEKLDRGFRVLKLKIGGIDFDDEVDLLRAIRSKFGRDSLELRLDANGSFTPDNAMERLTRLSAFDIHSLEQPVKAGQIELMAAICRRSPIAIALDEELIGVRTPAESEALVKSIMPQYIILKPSLCGGFRAAETYIDIAKRNGIGWWATSALESNVGLYAIASWVAGIGVTMPQGLGTGQLYSNNIPSGMVLRGPELFNDPTLPPVDLNCLPWRQ